MCTHARKHARTHARARVCVCVRRQDIHKTPNLKAIGRETQTYTLDLNPTPLPPTPYPLHLKGIGPEAQMLELGELPDFLGDILRSQCPSLFSM